MQQIKKIAVDIIILCGNLKNEMNDLINLFDCNTYVTTSNIPFYKCEQWKKDSEQLHLRFHSVAQQGAFVLNF